MRLFLATAMTDDRIAQANRALANDRSRERAAQSASPLPSAAEGEIKTIVAMGLCSGF